MLLVMAGTPGTFMHLSRARVTFIERTPRLEIGALSADAAREALAGPLRDRGVIVVEEALTEAAAEAQNYPYFLQVWGWQLWCGAFYTPVTGTNGRIEYRKREPRLIDRTALEFARAAAGQICADLYRVRTGQFRHWGILPLLAELALDAGSCRSEASVTMFKKRAAARWPAARTARR